MAGKISRRGGWGLGCRRRLWMGFGAVLPAPTFRWCADALPAENRAGVFGSMGGCKSAEGVVQRHSANWLLYTKNRTRQISPKKVQ